MITILECLIYIFACKNKKLWLDILKDLKLKQKENADKRMYESIQKLINDLK